MTKEATAPALALTQEDRKIGFYWIRWYHNGGDWTIGHWRGEGWEIVGSNISNYRDDELLEIGASVARLAATAQPPQGVDRAYLIRKGAYFYRANAEGYTADPAKAGRFTLEEAESYSHPNGADGPRDGIDYFHEAKVAGRALTQTGESALRSAFVAGFRAAEKAVGCEGQDERDNESAIAWEEHRTALTPQVGEGDTYTLLRHIRERYQYSPSEDDLDRALLAAYNAGLNTAQPKASEASDG